MSARTVRQRWWSTRALGQIRRGVEAGRYHTRFTFGRRYYEVLFVQRSRELTLYERGLVAGFRSVIGDPDRRLSPD